MKQDGINTKKAYMAWQATLSSVELAELAKVEKLAGRKLGIVAPKGLAEWREFVTACVDLYMVRQGAKAAPVTLSRPNGAATRHAAYLASIVIASNCGICGPRDKASCGSCYPADSEGNALVVEPVKLVEPTWLDSVERPVSYRCGIHGRGDKLCCVHAVGIYADGRGEVVPVRVEWPVEPSAQEADDARETRAAGWVMTSTLGCMEGHDGGLYREGISMAEVKLAGGSRHMVVKAIGLGWVGTYPMEHGDVTRFYLTVEGVTERDRRLSPFPLSAPAPGMPPRMEDYPVQEDQLAEPTRVTVTAVVERRARYSRRKPSCCRRGWK